MNKATFFKVIQLVFGSIASLCSLYSSLIISLTLEHFAPFVIMLLIAFTGIIYLMLVRKRALFTVGLIIGIFAFFTIIFMFFQDVKLH